MVIFHLKRTLTYIVSLDMESNTVTIQDKQMLNHLPKVSWRVLKQREIKLWFPNYSFFFFFAHLQHPIINPKYYICWFYWYFPLFQQRMPSVLWPSENLTYGSHSASQLWKIKVLWDSLVSSFTWSDKTIKTQDDVIKK